MLPAQLFCGIQQTGADPSPAKCRFDGKRAHECMDAGQFDACAARDLAAELGNEKESARCVVKVIHRQPRFRYES